MKNINVYGSGCKSCATTAIAVQKAADELGIEVSITKIQDLEKIMEAGIMTTPGISIDGNVCHSGSIPSDELVKQLLLK